jgi:hypothetical protein
MKTYVVTLVMLMLSLNANAQSKKSEPCSELSKKEQVLVTCQDKGHSFDRITVSYRVLEVSNCTSMAQGFVTIATAEGKPKRYAGAVFNLSQLDSFNTTLENTLPLTLFPVPMPPENPQNGSTPGGIMISLFRTALPPNSIVGADLAIKGSVFSDLVCTEK